MHGIVERLRPGVDQRVVRGVVAGFVAGLLFLLANMWYADGRGKPAVAPLYDISTIFYFSDKPDPTPENAVVGLIVHLTLAGGFGALLAVVVPLFASRRALALGAVAFGLALYVVNFQVLGRLVFEWFQKGPDQAFEVVAHAGFGLLLAPFLLGYASEAERPEAAPAAQPRPARA